MSLKIRQRHTMNKKTKGLREKVEADRVSDGPMCMLNKDKDVEMISKRCTRRKVEENEVKSKEKEKSSNRATCDGGSNVEIEKQRRKQQQH